MSCEGGEWGSKGYVWESLDYDTEYGVSVELIDVSSRQARVKVYPSFDSSREMIISKGESIEIEESSASVWTVHCDDVVGSMAQAKIRICHVEEGTPEPDPTVDGYELPLYGSIKVFGHTFHNTRLMCRTAQALIRPEGLAAKAVMVGAPSVVFAVKSIVSPATARSTGVIMGGIYVSLLSIDAACTKATVDIFQSTWTEDDHNALVDEIVDEVGSGGTGEFTDEEIEDAITEAEQNVKNSDEYKKIVEDVQSGKITPEEGDRRTEALVDEETYRILYEENFSINIPSIVMAGDVDVSGYAPKQNSDIQIVAVRKHLGFDWLAADSVLATPRAGDDYNYDAVVTLGEFGLVDVYARIPKNFWEVLSADLKTSKHTVLVVTPMMLIALLAMLAMVLDKKYNFIGMFKRRGKK